MTEWVVVGTGNVGRTLVKIAPRVDASVRSTWSKHKPFDDSPRHIIGDLGALADDMPGAVVFLSVRDDVIAEVAAAVPNLDQAAAVFHLSGVRSSEILSPFTKRGASIHPVLSITDPVVAADRLADAFWTVEGTNESVTYAVEMLRKLGANPATIDPENKALYHCAAVMAAGHFVTLLAAALEVASSAGLTPADSERMLFTLARSCLDNAQTSGVASAFTGPVARGDLETIAAHRAALDDAGLEEELAVYDTLRAYPWQE